MIRKRVEVRSVNHRFLQVRHRLPGELGELEHELEALLRKKLARGSVSVRVDVQRHGEAAAFTVDLEVARRYRRALQETARAIDVVDDLSISTIAQLPGVIGSPLDDRVHERERKLALATARKAVDALLEMRGTEGESLEKDLLKHAKAIAAVVKRVEKRMPTVVRQQLDALKARASELMGADGALERQDLARELALLADRTDVSEELARLRSHLDQLHALLAKGGTIGRQLDFLVQELHREANTIGSKSGDAKVSHDVVQLKTHIERVREQVQNVE